MDAELVMIGSELLLGVTVDTNATLLARALRDIGVDLHYKTTVGDDEARITGVLELALARSEVVITSGGLGPTVDDKTRQAVAQATGRPLVYRPELEEQISARFRSFGKAMAPNNRRQAYIPEGSLALPNPVGTAPCFVSEDRRGRGVVISLPGVPRELEIMLKDQVIPWLIDRMGGRRVTRVRVLRTSAVGESNVDQAIGDLMTRDNPRVGLAAHAGQTDIRITARADTEEEADALIQPLEAILRQRLGVAIYGTGRETLPQVVGRLLTDKQWPLGVYDALTEGQLVRELEEAGYGDRVSIRPSSAPAVEIPPGEPPRSLALKLAAEVTPPGGVGLALVGPLEGRRTLIALKGPDGLETAQWSRYHDGSGYARRWLVIQGLDWLRRALLGRLTSPVDWQGAEEAPIGA